MLKAPVLGGNMAGSNLKILIADDVEENRELLRATVEPEGFDAYCVPNSPFNKCQY